MANPFRKEPRRPARANPQGLRVSQPQARTPRPANSIPVTSIFRNAAPVIPAEYNAPRAMTAAATQVRLKDKREAEQFRQRRQSNHFRWQQEAWEYYDAIGEVKYAFNLVASVVSRIRLYAAVIEDPSETPVAVKNSTTVDPRLADMAERALARLDSAYGGQAGLLKDAALNLSVAGECYLVQLPERTLRGQHLPESWDIRSVDELQVDQKGNYFIVPRRDLVGQAAAKSDDIISLHPDAFTGRIWRAHPRFSDEPDASLRGLLDLCDELLLLSRAFRGTAKSRLNAGALYLPDGLSVAASPDPNYPYDEEGEPVDDGVTPEEAEDEFEDQLIDAMTTPITDEESASSVVPLIIRGPAELADKIKQFSFERSFDDVLAKRAERVLERILQGLDVPKDIVTGLANVKYSNAIQIDEALYKAHIEPLLLLISDAITVVYLRPYLLQNGFTDAEVQRLVVWYDPSAVATRNDRAADADSGFEKMAISFQTWRGAHGFSEADAPSPNELAIRLLMTNGSITPELSEQLLAVIAPDIMAAARAAQQNASVAPIPTEVNNLLNGQPAEPTDPNAPPAEPLAEPEGAAPGAPADPAAPAAPAAEGDVAPGEDAPPFPLAEPK